MTAPLDDITVIAIDSWMAAPSAAAILADMGANVIKIEPLVGDPMRDMSRPAKIPGDAARYDYQFDVDNRGKKSIAVALDTPEGAELVQKLVTKADIFMCNLLTERQSRFGLDPESLLAANPKLVHATLTGYGTTGPDAWRPGYDVTAFFGRSGLYDSMREGEDGSVPQARPAQGDHTTGLSLVAAILAALRVVEKTGEGEVVETSLFETAIWTQATDYCVTAVDSAPVRHRSRDTLLAPLSNRYPCGDNKWVVFNMPAESAWPKFCKIIDRAAWIDDERIQDPSGRYKHMAELVAGIDDALAAKSRDEWGEIFDAEGMIWGPVLGLHEVADDPQAHAIGMFPPLSNNEIGEYKSVRIPMRFRNADVGPKSSAPKLGADTTQVLEDFGIAADQVASLAANGIINRN